MRQRKREGKTDGPGVTSQPKKERRDVEERSGQAVIKEVESRHCSSAIFAINQILLTVIIQYCYFLLSPR